LAGGREKVRKVYPKMEGAPKREGSRYGQFHFGRAVCQLST